jgi:hypothetical protein
MGKRAKQLLDGVVSSMKIVEQWCFGNEWGKQWCFGNGKMVKGC